MLLPTFPELGSCYLAFTPVCEWASLMVQCGSALILQDMTSELVARADIQPQQVCIAAADIHLCIIVERLHAVPTQ